jgi:hypothetical protein
MTIERIQQVAQFYYDILRARRIEPVRQTGHPSCHICYCVDVLRLSTVVDGKPLSIGKMNRWLGFVQGWFWTQRFFTVDELKDHNRPDLPAPIYKKAVV